MAIKRTRVLVNGFGRIGRILLRQLISDERFDIVAINDLVEDVSNLTYLYNYDSHYGRSANRAMALPDKNQISINGQNIKVFRSSDMRGIPFDILNIDVVIDATGVHENIEHARILIDEGHFKKMIVTHAPKKGADAHIIMGVNDRELNVKQHDIIAASICDANAIAHPISVLDEEYGIASGFVTTLHPWLSYQNLVDGPLVSQANPAHYWKDYSLGRSSVGALIPKDTTAVKALEFVMPGISKRIKGFSYRIPTNVVCSADITLFLNSVITVEEAHAVLRKKLDGSPYVAFNDESLISKDYEANPYSCIIDTQWTSVTNGQLLKIVCWYDNEWGYSSRVKDLLSKIVKEI